MPKSVRAWFLLIYLVVALAGAAVLLVTFSRMSAIRRQSLQNDSVEASRTAADRTHLFLAEALHTEEDLSRALTVAGKVAQRQDFLAHTLRHHAEFQDLYYIAGDQALHAGAHVATPSALQERAAVRQVSGGQPWSVAYNVDSSGEPSVELALLVADDHGANEGILLGIIAPSSLADVLSPGTGTAMVVFDHSGRGVCDAGGDQAQVVALLSGEPGLFRALSGDSVMTPRLRSRRARSTIIASFVPVPYFGWAVAAVVDTRPGVAVLITEERRVAALSGLVFVVGFILVQWRTAALLQAIRRLQRAAQAMAGGDFRYRVRLTTRSEMDTLAGLFNEMAARLEQDRNLVEDRNQQLNVLLRLVEGMRPERDREGLLRRITQDAAFLTSAGVAFLAQVQDAELQVKEWWNGLRWDEINLHWSLGEGVPGWVWLQHDTRFAENYTDDVHATEELGRALDLRNFVCSPIVLPNGAVEGVLFVANKAREAVFAEDDVRIIELLARHAGVALEVEAAFLRERSIGATLQKAMLPDVDPNLGGLSIARRYQASTDDTELGGDFYDVIALSPDRIGLVIADVSGKGLGAAVQTAAVKYALRAYALEDPEPSSVLRRLNSSCNTGPANRGFVTLFYGVIDLRRWEMQYANAGHVPPLLRRSDGSVQALEARGAALGVGPGSLNSYPTRATALRGGDTLVLYTDGLSEARREDEFLDVEGVEALLGDLDTDANETAQLLLEGATTFAEGRLRDDVALLVVKIPLSNASSEDIPHITTSSAA